MRITKGSGSRKTTVSVLGFAWSSPVPFVSSSSSTFSFFISTHCPLQCNSGRLRFSHSSFTMRCLFAPYHANTPRQPKHWNTSENRSKIESVFFKLLSRYQVILDTTNPATESPESLLQSYCCVAGRSASVCCQEMGG